MQGNNKSIYKIFKSNYLGGTYWGERLNTPKYDNLINYVKGSCSKNQSIPYLWVYELSNWISTKKKKKRLKFVEKHHLIT